MVKPSANKWTKHVVSFLQYPHNWKLINLIRSYDEVLFEHSIDSAWLVDCVAQQLKLSSTERMISVYAALLHDVGKIHWPEEFKTKYPLSGNDWIIIQAHPSNGTSIVQDIWPQAPELLLRIIQEHHEKPSGDGYPAGISKKHIHPLSQLVAASESYSAMISERPYRLSALTHEKAIKILADNNYSENIIECLHKLGRGN